MNLEKPPEFIRHKEDPVLLVLKWFVPWFNNYPYALELYLGSWILAAVAICIALYIDAPLLGGIGSWSYFLLLWLWIATSFKDYLLPYYEKYFNHNNTQ